MFWSKRVKDVAIRTFWSWLGGESARLELTGVEASELYRRHRVSNLLSGRPEAGGEVALLLLELLLSSLRKICLTHLSYYFNTFDVLFQQIWRAISTDLTYHFNTLNVPFQHIERAISTHLTCFISMTSITQASVGIPQYYKSAKVKETGMTSND